MTSRFLLPAAALCAVSVACTCAFAGYTATSRTSTISTSTWANPNPNPNTTVIASTSDFALFTYYQDLGQFRYTAQTSTLTPLGATYTGKSYGESSGTPQHMSGNFSSSYFELRFTLTTPTVFHLDGSIQRTLSATSSILLQRLSAPVVKYEATAGNSAPFPPIPVHFTGTLPAGNYKLVKTDTGQVNSSPIGSGSDSSFTFSVDSCAGDLNADAVVDDADFSFFAAAYDLLDCADPSMPAGCPSDLNHDAFVDDADFILFASAYDTLLCP